MKEELTDKMHSEFTIDSETEISHRVCTVCKVVLDGHFDLKEALELYDVTKAEYDKYSPKWKKLIS